MIFCVLPGSVPENCRQCHAQARCVFDVGCQCIPGYEGNGTFCSPVPRESFSAESLVIIGFLFKIKTINQPWQPKSATCYPSVRTLIPGKQTAGYRMSKLRSERRPVVSDNVWLSACWVDQFDPDVLQISCLPLLHLRSCSQNDTKSTNLCFYVYASPKYLPRPLLCTKICLKLKSFSLCYSLAALSHKTHFCFKKWSRLRVLINFLQVWMMKSGKVITFPVWSISSYS